MNWNDSCHVNLISQNGSHRVEVSQDMTADRAKLIIDALTYHVVKDLGEISADFYESNYFDGDSKKSGMVDYDRQSREFAAEHVEKRLEYFLNGDKKKKILEIGCAFGHTVDELNTRGYSAFGLDISEYAIRKYYNTYKIRHDITQIPLAMGADFVYSFAMMEHVAREDVRQTIKNIWDSMAPGGVYFATIDNVWGADLSHQTIMPREWWNRMFTDQRFVLDEIGTERFKKINGYVFRRPE